MHNLISSSKKDSVSFIDHWCSKILWNPPFWHPCLWWTWTSSDLFWKKKSWPPPNLCLASNQPFDWRLPESMAAASSNRRVPKAVGLRCEKNWPVFWSPARPTIQFQGHCHDVELPTRRWKNWQMQVMQREVCKDGGMRICKGAIRTFFRFGLGSLIFGSIFKLQLLNGSSNDTWRQTKDSLWKQHDLQRLSNELKTCICQSNVFAKFHCHLASCKKVSQLIGSCCICQLDPSELRCHTDIQKRLSLRQLHFALSFLRWFRMTWLHSPAHQTTTQWKSFVKAVPWSQFKNDQTKLYTRKKKVKPSRTTPFLLTCF